MSCEDRLIRDKIVIGIKSDDLRKSLLADPKLTLEKAVNTCRASESLTQQAKLLMVNDNSQCDIASAKPSSGFRSVRQGVCKRCGTAHGFGLKNCPAKSNVCSKCNIRGHYTEKCLTKNPSFVNKRQANIAEAGHQDLEEEEEYSLHVNTIGNVFGEENDWYESATINGELVKFKLDTGAQCNIITKTIADKCNAEIKKSSINYNNF